MHIYIEPNELPERQQSNVDMNGKLYAVGQFKGTKNSSSLLLPVPLLPTGDLQEEIIQSGLHFRF